MPTVREVWVVEWLTPNVHAFEWRLSYHVGLETLTEITTDPSMNIRGLRFYPVDVPQYIRKEEMESWLRENVEML